MLKLFVKNSTGQARKYAIADGEYVIGRDPCCAIHLDDPKVSRRHAKLICSNRKLRIIDLGSSNGTFLNSQRITEKTVSARDVIELADYTLMAIAAAGGKNCSKRTGDLKNSKNRSLASKPVFVVFSLLAVVVLLISFAGRKSGHGRESAREQENAVMPVERDKENTRGLADSADTTRVYDNGIHQKKETGMISDREKPRKIATRKPEITNLKSRIPKSLPKEHRNSRLNTRRRARIAPAAVSKTVSSVILSDGQRKEAESLYVQAYRVMQYRNQNAYLQALVLFKKVLEIAPDKDFRFYQKAQEKIELIKRELAQFPTGK
jgi:pSer/pThr/pTyr-binding forkhead associated (FHA) protein